MPGADAEGPLPSWHQGHRLCSSKLHRRVRHRGGPHGPVAEVRASARAAPTGWQPQAGRPGQVGRLRQSSRADLLEAGRVPCSAPARALEAWLPHRTPSARKGGRGPLGGRAPAAGGAKGRRSAALEHVRTVAATHSSAPALGWRCGGQEDACLSPHACTTPQTRARKYATGTLRAPGPDCPTPHACPQQCAHTPGSPSAIHESLRARKLAPARVHRGSLRAQF